MKIDIITRCTRLDNLAKIQQSIYDNKFGHNISWHILFDTSVIRDIPAELIENLSLDSRTTLHYIKGQKGDLLYPQSMPVVKQFSTGWVYYLDDDNMLHPNYYEEMYAHEHTKVKHPDKIIIGNQFVNFKDFTGQEYRQASPDNTKYQHVDLAQITWHSSIFKVYNFIGDYAADGKLVEKIHIDHPDWFTFIDRELCYYNYLVNSPNKFVPKVMYIGPGKPMLKSDQPVDWEDSDLNVLHLKNDNNISEHLYSFNPDAIITLTDDPLKVPELYNQGLEVRNKWFTASDIDSKESLKKAGDAAYRVAMYNMLVNDVQKDMVSWFTPIYNTGERLRHTYQSLQNQTNPYWEWVLVNDSTDGNVTISIAEEIAKMDPRVKLYDFVNKSGGIVGEAKYRAAVLCKGELLAELDHDDYLTPEATQMLYDAMEAYPDAGFYYTDSVEVDEDWVSLEYGEGFACGYGQYRDETVMGRKFSVQITPNLNPKTIRHIVGVPNHIRSWRRDLYFQIGGHNRGLSIADDYELLVRTFLSTKMCLIPRLAYIQFIYNDGLNTNTHSTSRRDIQRRVRTIQEHYNEDIAKRFEDFGLKDWAYEENPSYPGNVESKYGDEENYVNYIHGEAIWSQ